MRCIASAYWPFPTNGTNGARLSFLTGKKSMRCWLSRTFRPGLGVVIEPFFSSPSKQVYGFRS